METITLLSEVKEVYEKRNYRLYVKVQQKRDLLMKVKEILLKDHGPIPVFLYYEDLRKMQQLPPSYGISGKNATIEELQHLLGKEQILLKED